MELSKKKIVRVIGFYGFRIVRAVVISRRRFYLAHNSEMVAMVKKMCLMSTLHTVHIMNYMYEKTVFKIIVRTLGAFLLLL